MQRRSERGSQLEHRESDDVYHQRGPTAIAIGDRPEEKRADGPHRQRQENCLENGGNLRVEFGGNGAHAESQNEKIESIQRPPQKTGHEGVALRRSQAPKMCQKLDGLLPGSSSTVCQSHRQPCLCEILRT